MKRCPYCGAKNKDQYDDCVRCSSSLDHATETSSSILSSVVPVIVLILLAIAFVATWRYLNPAADNLPEARPSARDSAPAEQAKNAINTIDSNEVFTHPGIFISFLTDVLGQ